MGDDRHGFIDRRLLHAVQGQLDNQITTTPAETEIDIWLESGGGDANVAYKMILELRSRCSRLRTIIPDYAKSAATLLALGTDVIYMSEAAELGPLDMQIEHPDREGYRISALDVADALNWLAKFAIDYTIGGGAGVLHWTGLPRLEVLREMLGFSATLLEPIVGKLDPLLIHKAANELGVAKQYAQILLEGRRLKEGDEEHHPDVSKIVDDLVSNYPAHDFCISRHVAAAMGLPVRLATKYSKWKLVKRLHNEYQSAVFSGKGPKNMIQLIEEKELAANGKARQTQKSRGDGHGDISAKSGQEDSKATASGGHSDGSQVKPV